MARVNRTLKVSQQYFSIKLLMCQPFQGMLQLHQELCLHNFPLMKSKSQAGGGSGSCRKLRSPLWALALTLRCWRGPGRWPGQPFPEQTLSTIAASSKHKERERNCADHTRVCWKVWSLILQIPRAEGGENQRLQQ